MFFEIRKWNTQCAWSYHSK